ncbi:MAG: hypothetical protein M1831_005552 [Alyxoria varia]|nr:MAG: hypothetical protein M1831_005552 [Alyxoria varia]
MQFTTILLAAGLSASSALAAPAGVTTNMMATGQWTMENFRRTCGPLGQACTYTYNINSHNGPATPCKYEIRVAKDAARAPYNNIKCGAYTISSGWSGQFGPENGFQTLAVVKDRQIIYPAYTDKQLAGGKIVAPNHPTLLRICLRKFERLAVVEYRQIICMQDVSKLEGVALGGET